MRILQVTDWNPGRGGSEAYVEWLVKNLPAAGHEVRLLTSNAGTAAEGRADFIAPASRHPAAQVFLQIGNPFAVAATRGAIRKFRPEVIHLHLFAYHLSPAIVWAFGDIPFVTTIHDYKSVCPTGTKLLPDGRICTQRAGAVCREACLGTLHWLRDQPRYALIGRALRRAAATLVHSETMAATLRSHGSHPVLLPIPVPVTANCFQRQTGLHPQFVCAARLEREKGVELLIRSFARLRSTHHDARLRIVGDGQLRPALAALARQLAPAEAIEFCGWRNGSEIDQWLADAWALVAPSLWAEPFGLVAPEAILRGVPVVCSRTGGLAESVTPGLSGLLFENGDGDDLLAQLDAVASGRAFPDHRCDPMAVRALRERHDPTLHLTGLSDVYGSVPVGTRGG